jgi:hypothetical protein
MAAKPSRARGRKTDEDVIGFADRVLAAEDGLKMTSGCLSLTNPISTESG